MNIILFDDPARAALLPLTFTRPVAALRWGIQTFAERWQSLTEADVSYLTEGYLRPKFAPVITNNNLLVNGALVADDALAAAVAALPSGQALRQGNRLLAAHLTADDAMQWMEAGATIERWLGVASEYEAPVHLLEHWWDLFAGNGAVLEADFQRLTAGRTSAAPGAGNTLIGPQENLFLEAGASVQGAILNLNNGPIYLGKDAEIMEGSVVRGPLALGEHAVVKMAAKIYGPTTVGPWCKVGGEINNCIFTGYSNKGHDGFLGNSVIGEWCNLGADTNTSNLKNDYGPVKVWSYPEAGMVNSGRQFCGLLMGDHAKSGINIMFNTGTVVGVSANVFGSGFPPKFIPSFSWGGADELVPFRFDKAEQVATRMMERRGIAYDAVEHGILDAVFRQTEVFRA